MSDYTPTTAEVRGAWVAARCTSDEEIPGQVAEFNRWLGRARHRCGRAGDGGEEGAGMSEKTPKERRKSRLMTVDKVYLAAMAGAGVTWGAVAYQHGGPLLALVVSGVWAAASVWLLDVWGGQA